MNGWRVTLSMLQVHAPCDGGPLEGDAPGQQVRPRVPPAPAPWRPPLQHLLLLLLQTVLGAAGLHPPRGATAAGPERGLPLPECLHSGLGYADCNLCITAAHKPEIIRPLPIAIVTNTILSKLYFVAAPVTCWSCLIKLFNFNF